MDPVLGIDFGTSKICCAVWMDGTIKLVTTENGKTMMPAYFVLDEIDVVLGQEARELSTINFETCIYDMIRFFGKTTTEAAELWIANTYPFRLGFRTDSPLYFLLQHGETTRKHSVRSIVGLFIQKMKNQAEKMIGQPITKCCFALAEWQKEVHPDVALQLKRAGFQEVYYLGDQDAILSGCLDKTIDTHIRDSYQEHVFVVVDVGVVTTRISIATVYPVQRSFNWLKMDSIPIGGRWFDQQLVEHCAEEFFKQHQLNLRDNLRAMHRLRLKCEEAKIQLSTSSKWFDITLEGLHEGKGLDLRLSPAVFDKLCGTGAQEINRFIIITIRDAGVQHNQPNLHILLVGGGSRISLLRRLIEWAYPNSFDKSVAGYVEEAAAYGAARLGAQRFLSQYELTVRNSAPPEVESGQNARSSAELTVPKNIRKANLTEVGDKINLKATQPARTSFNDDGSPRNEAAAAKSRKGPISEQKSAKEKEVTDCLPKDNTGNTNRIYPELTSGGCI